MSDWNQNDTGGFTADDGGGFTADSTEGFAADGNWEPSGTVDGQDEGGRPSGGCFNCGEDGHNKADCPNPKVDRPFTGTCRTCNEEGHRAAECPSKPPTVCRLCNEEGHRAAECTAARTDIWPSDTPAISAEDAWIAMKTADDDKNMDDFKINFFAYCKTMQSEAPVNAADLESGFRESDMNMHLIAKEKKKSVPDNMTIASLAGVIDQPYILTFSWSAKPRNKVGSIGWPASPEENLEHLKEAGLVVDRGVPMCHKCGKLGHTQKSCREEDLVIREKLEITCHRCNEVGHRIRDCPQERVEKGKNLCRNCQQPGHKASDCTEPRSAAGVECKKCNEMGHFARDCPNVEPRVRACRNCDDLDHIAKDCPKPKDWSRVQCSNCDQFGHTKVKCKEPPKEVEGDPNNDWAAGGGEVQPADAGSAVEDWMKGGDSFDEGVSLNQTAVW